MKIIYRTGDLLNATERFIVHGCNARGVMGKGVAKLIREKYPKAYEFYRQRFEDEGLRLGQTVWAKGEPHTIINAITQDGYRQRSEDERILYADYEAIRGCFKQINATAHFSRELNARWLGHPIDAIAMPLIGAGLAGGHWPTIAQIIEETSECYQPVVYTLDGVIPS